MENRSGISRFVAEHYMARMENDEEGKRARQINISISVDTYAFLKAASDQFQLSLSAFCADILHEASYETLSEVAAFSKDDANALRKEAAEIAESEAEKMDIDLRWGSRWASKDGLGDELVNGDTK